MLKSTLRSPEASAPAVSAAPWTFHPGDVLAGKYSLVRPLGAGSMGQVWVARNGATDAEVAVKVLLPERAGAEDAFERFRREAHTMSRLSHRGIFRAFDLVEHDPAKGSLLLVMELLRGQTLAQPIEQAGRLTVTETIQIALPILSALDHAHADGVVHRDLKPDNIFLAVEPDGQILPKLVDFGISKMRHDGVLTKRGALVGTPCYMAPEQARGEDIDARSDIFSLGIVLYECLSGKPPFSGDTLYATVTSVLETEPPVLDDVPVDLWTVVARALAKRADDRYASAADLAKAIVTAVPGLQATLRSVPPGPTSFTVPPAVSRTTTTMAEHPPRSRRALVVAAACVAGVAAAAAIGPRRVASPLPPFAPAGGGGCVAIGGAGSPAGAGPSNRSRREGHRPRPPLSLPLLPHKRSPRRPPCFRRARPARDRPTSPAPRRRAHRSTRASPPKRRAPPSRRAPPKPRPPHRR